MRWKEDWSFVWYGQIHTGRNCLFPLSNIMSLPGFWQQILSDVITNSKPSEIETLWKMNHNAIKIKLLHVFGSASDLQCNAPRQMSWIPRFWILTTVVSLGHPLYILHHILYTQQYFPNSYCRSRREFPMLPCSGQVSKKSWRLAGISRQKKFSSFIHFFNYVFIYFSWSERK